MPEEEVVEEEVVEEVAKPLVDQPKLPYEMDALEPYISKETL